MTKLFRATVIGVLALSIISGSLVAHAANRVLPSRRVLVYPEKNELDKVSHLEMVIKGDHADIYFCGMNGKCSLEVSGSVTQLQKIAGKDALADKIHPDTIIEGAKIGKALVEFLDATATLREIAKGGSEEGSSPGGNFLVEGILLLLDGVSLTVDLITNEDAINANDILISARTATIRFGTKAVIGMRDRSLEDLLDACTFLRMKMEN